MLDAVGEPSLGSNTAIPCAQKYMNASEQSCFQFCQSEHWVALTCYPLAYFYIETKLCVCKCMKECSQDVAPELLTQLYVYAQVCTERKRGKLERRGIQENAG